MDVLSVITDLAGDGALDRIAEQTGVAPFQIGHAVRDALQQAEDDRPRDEILASSIANAGISPSLARSVQSALMPIIGHYFAPAPRGRWHSIQAGRGSEGFRKRWRDGYRPDH